MIVTIFASVVIASVNITALCRMPRALPVTAPLGTCLEPKPKAASSALRYLLLYTRLETHVFLPGKWQRLKHHICLFSKPHTTPCLHACIF